MNCGLGLLVRSCDFVASLARFGNPRIEAEGWLKVNNRCLKRPASTELIEADIYV